MPLKAAFVLVDLRYFFTLGEEPMVPKLIIWVKKKLSNREFAKAKVAHTHDGDFDLDAFMP